MLSTMLDWQWHSGAWHAGGGGWWWIFPLVFGLLLLGILSTLVWIALRLGSGTRGNPTGSAGPAA